MRVQMHFQRIIEKFRNETNDSDDKLPAIAENNLFPLYPLSFIFKKSLNLWCHTIRHCCHVYLVWFELVLFASAGKRNQADSTTVHPSANSATHLLYFRMKLKIGGNGTR